MSLEALALEPMIAATGSIRQVRAFGDDPFESESACMLEHGWPVHIEMLATQALASGTLSACVMDVKPRENSPWALARAYSTKLIGGRGKASGSVCDRIKASPGA